MSDALSADPRPPGPPDVPTERGPTEPGPAGRGPARFGPWRRELRSFIELFALCGLTFAQPGLDLLAKNTSVLVDLHASRLEAIGIAFAAGSSAPPTLLWSGRGARRRRAPREPAGTSTRASRPVSPAVFFEEVLKHQTELGGTRAW